MIGNNDPFSFHEVKTKTNPDGTIKKTDNYFGPVGYDNDKNSSTHHGHVVQDGDGNVTMTRDVGQPRGEHQKPQN